MDTSGPRRELDAFVSEVTPTSQVATGRVSTLPGVDGASVRSGFVQAFVADELERAADAPEYEAGDGEGICWRALRASRSACRWSSPSWRRREIASMGSPAISPLASSDPTRSPWIAIVCRRLLAGTCSIDRSARWTSPRNARRRRGPRVHGGRGCAAHGGGGGRHRPARAALGARHRIRWVYDVPTRAPVLAVAADPRSSRIEFACRLLARLGDRRDVPALEEVTVHPDHFVRWTALQSIVQLDLARGNELIEAALDDPHPHIRRAAHRFVRDADPALVEQRS